MGGPRGTRRRIGRGGLHGGGGLWLAAAWHLAVPCPRSVRHRFWATAFSFVVCSGVEPGTSRKLRGSTSELQTPSLISLGTRSS